MPAGYFIYRCANFLIPIKNYRNLLGKILTLSPAGPTNPGTPGFPVFPTSPLGPGFPSKPGVPSGPCKLKV